MKQYKVFLVIAIIIATVLSILYLVMQARRLERYTISEELAPREFIIYSSQGGTLQDGVEIGKILEYVEEVIDTAGYDAEGIDYISEENFRKQAIREMEDARQYILLDINASKLVINKDTVLARIGTNGNSKVQENLELANIMKEILKRDIKVNILKDSKGNYNQDLGYRSLHLTISSSHDYQSAKFLVSEILKALIK